MKNENICQYCHKSFIPSITSPQARYCSVLCRNRAKAADPEFRKRLSIAVKKAWKDAGGKGGNKGRKLPAETREKMSKARKGKNVLSKEELKKRVKARRNNPKFRLKMSISKGIRDSLKKGNKNGRHWETLVGYTFNDLKKHFEKQFTEGMSWENYGEWHIDHIIPVKVFNFDKPEHLDFKRCWALKNLRPLWAKDNILKRAKITTSFQPSLKL